MMTNTRIYSIKRWCYSSSKALVEHYLEACSFQDNLEFRVVRLFNIYGPNLKNRVIARFIENALLNKNLELNNGGNQTRCFTYRGCYRAFNLIIDSDDCKIKFLMLEIPQKLQLRI